MKHNGVDGFFIETEGVITCYSNGVVNNNNEKSHKQYINDLITSKNLKEQEALEIQNKLDEYQAAMELERYLNS